MIALLSGHSPGATAIIDADRGVSISFAELCDRVLGAAQGLDRLLAGRLAFLVASNTVRRNRGFFSLPGSKSPHGTCRVLRSGRPCPLKGNCPPTAFILPEGRLVPEGVSPFLKIGTYQVYAAPGASSPKLIPICPSCSPLRDPRGSPKLVRFDQAESCLKCPGDRLVSQLGTQGSSGAEFAIAVLLRVVLN